MTLKKHLLFGLEFFFLFGGGTGISIASRGGVMASDSIFWEKRGTWRVYFDDVTKGVMASDSVFREKKGGHMECLF